MSSAKFKTVLIHLRVYAMEEETVNCANCGREVPKTLYCIYCGSALFANKEARKDAAVPEVTVESKPEPITPETRVEMPSQEEAPPTPSVEFKAKPRRKDEPAVDPEVAELMDEFKKNYIWKVKLCGVLCDGGVSEEVFINLFEEYINKINQLSQVRNERIAYYRKDFEGKKTQLEEMERRLEELKVRTAIGQISSQEMKAQVPELEEKIKNLTSETTRLEAQLLRLNDLMRGTPPKGIFDLEKRSRRCLESLDSMITNGKITNKLGGELRKDLEAVLNVFDSIIGDKKQREKELRDELSTQEARYKVGEITISEFEAHKRRVTSELEKIWL